MRICLLLSFLITSFIIHAQQNRKIESTIETVNIQTKERKIIYKEERHIEAPNWSKDGQYLVVNSNGLLYRLSLQKPGL
ncbi:MAG: transporter, partial [Flavisolibacter sp.]|nr:transporter [Flavisolibacter sp.]